MKNHDIPKRRKNSGTTSRNQAFQRFRKTYFPLPYLFEGVPAYEAIDAYTDNDPLPKSLLHVSDMPALCDAVRDLRQCSGQLAWLQGVAAFGLQTPAENMEINQHAISHAPSRLHFLHNIQKIYYEEVEPRCPPDVLKQLQEHFTDWPCYQHKYNLLMYRAGYLLASYVTAPENPLPPNVAERLQNMLCTAISDPNDWETFSEAGQYDNLAFWYEDVSLYKNHNFDDCTPTGELFCTLDDLATERIFDKSGHQAWVQGVVAYVSHAPATELGVDEQAIRQSESYQAGIKAVRQMYANDIKCLYTAKDLQELHAFYKDWPDYLHRNNLIMYVAGYLTGLTMIDPHAVLSEDAENRLADMYMQSAFNQGGKAI